MCVCVCVCVCLCVCMHTHTHPRTHTHTDRHTHKHTHTHTHTYTHTTQEAKCQGRTGHLAPNTYRTQNCIAANTYCTQCAVLHSVKHLQHTLLQCASLLFFLKKVKCSHFTEEKRYKAEPLPAKCARSELAHRQGEELLRH
jgi:hypothetical protein